MNTNIKNLRKYQIYYNHYYLHLSKILNQKALLNQNKKMKFVTAATTKAFDQLSVFGTIYKVN